MAPFTLHLNLKPWRAFVQKLNCFLTLYGKWGRTRPNGIREIGTSLVK